MVLQTTDLTLGYPGKVLCRNLNLTVNPGECWAILGQNGCGKTTLIHALGGLGSGGSRITLAGKALQAWRRAEVARKLGILLQEEPGEFWGSVYEYVLLGRHPHVDSLFGWRAADEQIAMMALERMELKRLAHRSLVTLSGGERQRTRLALLLTQSPQYYLLDEPLLHLDLRHQLGVMMLFKELAEQGNSVVMVLHDVGWANRFCDHAIMLFEDGHTITGPVKKVLNRDNLEALYQCNMANIAAGFNTGFFFGTMQDV
jgi:iron complex transport system ATP-binding protein